MDQLVLNFAGLPCFGISFPEFGRINPFFFGGLNGFGAAECGSCHLLGELDELEAVCFWSAA